MSPDQLAPERTSYLHPEPLAACEDNQYNRSFKGRENPGNIGTVDLDQEVLLVGFKHSGALISAVEVTSRR